MKTKHIVHAAMVLGMVALCASTHAQTLFVDGAATGAGNGVSWADAYTTIQAALDDPAAASGEVWVARGTYAEAIVLNSGNRVYGGFTSGATEIGQRDPAATPSIIDASGIPAPNHAVTIDAVTGTVFDGFNVTGGRATGEETDNANAGGGVFCRGLDESNSVSNLHLYGNTAGRHGGGLFVASSSIVIANCRIEDNETINAFSSAGGLSTGVSTFSTIRDCVIFNNRGGSFGGGLTLQGFSMLTVLDTQITSNSSELGGGVFVGTSTSTLERCVISENRAERGGGIWVSNTTGGTLRDCGIIGNEVGDEFGFGSGGGMLFSDATMNVENCHVMNNRAAQPQGDGGGMRISSSDVHFSGCVVGENFASRSGAGVLVDGTLGSPRFDRCMIYGNRGPDTISAIGGGAYVRDGSPSFHDTIFAGNDSPGAGALYLSANTNVTLDGCTISGNRSQSRHVVFLNNSQGRMINCVIGGNEGTSGENTGVGVQSNIEFLNCTFAEDGIGIRVNSGNTGLLVPNVINSIFARMSSYGVLETQIDDNFNVLNSLFYDIEDADYVDVVSLGGVRDARELRINQNITSGTIENNLRGNPIFRMDTFEGIRGTWTAVDYDSQTSRTVLTAAGAPFEDLSLAWRMVNPSSGTQMRQSLVLNNTASTLTVYGDAWGAQPGAEFRIIDYGLVEGSAAIDMGVAEVAFFDPILNTMLDFTAPALDIAGQARPVDIAGVGTDGAGVGFDSGAYEWNGLPPDISVRQLVNHLLAISPLPESVLPAADKNSDGTIDAGDIVTTVND